MAEIILPLDVPSRADALQIVDRLGEDADFYKVGLELFTAAGPELVSELKRRDKRVFLDLKLHDIPVTVARAVTGARALGVDLCTVHTLGGADMMRAAADAAEAKLLVVGVTVLTSMTVPDIEDVWAREISALREEIVRLTRLAADAGLGGVVASALEATAIRRAAGEDFAIVTPGIRFAEGDPHDQKRVATPGDAASAGADYLVIGRAVLGADDPVAALRRAREEVRLAESEIPGS
jgi:orotidine-5'-phosphate decarboxylase